VNLWAAKFGIFLINQTRHWSQRTRTRVAYALSDLVWWLAGSRRHVTLTNLRVCFPQMPEEERYRLGRMTFRSLGRAALDHSVLWNADRETIERYVRMEGGHHLADPANRPLIILAPHFVGLDAGGVRTNILVRGASIYSKQKNPVWDAWLLKARQRFSDPVLLPRQGLDMRAVIRILRDGLPLYYLPDMDLGPANSIFVPFFGVPTATIPMVSRLVRMTGAKVILAVTEMTDDGYVLHVEPPLADFPGASIEEDTARMNRELERWVLRMPAQYFWTHKRFKTRPEGSPSIY
jgi:Kdo2-lipid IVA lauroyltransferase/acyltransferase